MVTSSDALDMGGGVCFTVPAGINCTVFCRLSFCRFMASSLERRSMNCAVRGLGSFCFCLVYISFISTFDTVTRSFFISET